MRLVDEAERKDIATLFSYGENTVGALMTTDYAWLPATATAAEAIDQLRAQAPDKETIYYIYVVDEPVRRPDGSTYQRLVRGEAVTLGSVWVDEERGYVPQEPPLTAPPN